MGPRYIVLAQCRKYTPEGREEYIKRNIQVFDKKGKVKVKVCFDVYIDMFMCIVETSLNITQLRTVKDILAVHSMLFSW